MAGRGKTGNGDGKRIRSRVEIERDRAYIIRQRGRQRSFFEIWESLIALRKGQYEISLEQVRTDYNQALKEARQERIDATDKLIANEILWASNIEREAWEGFERSMRTKETRTTQLHEAIEEESKTETVDDIAKQLPAMGGRRGIMPSRKMTMKTEELIGNPIWLTLAFNVRQYRARMLGLLDPDIGSVVDAQFSVSDERPMVTDVEHDQVRILLSELTGAPLPLAAVVSEVPGSGAST